MMNQDNQQQFKPVIICLLFLFSLAPWLVFQLDRFMPADAAFLTLAAQDFLAGKSMTDAYFDNNPPMSYMIFIPSVLISTLGFELWQSHLIYTLSLIGIGSGFIAVYLSKLKSITPAFKLTLACAYIFATTIPMFQEFGQKDHLVAIAIFPLLLSQYILLPKQEDSSLCVTMIVILAFIIFTPFILLKPHYGLIPTAFILYRWYLTKSFRRIFQVDFFVLAFGVIAYIAIVYTMFPDFISEVLVLTLDIYVTSKTELHSPLLSLVFIFFIGCLMLLTYSNKAEKTEETQLVLILCAAAALCIIPFFLQGKGYSLHLMPFISVALIATAAIAYLYICRLNRVYQRIVIAIGLIASVFIGFTTKPANSETHAYYQDHPLVKELGIDKNSASFFIENNTTNVVYPISVYNHIQHASRFPSHWLLSDNLINLSKEEQNNIIDLIGSIVAEDITHHKPQIILLLNDDMAGGYLQLIKNHPDFSEAMSHYSAPRKFETDMLYFSETASPKMQQARQTYNLYRRKDIDQ